MPAGVSEEYRRAIGNAIREARKERGMSQDALRLAVGNSKNAVSNWERGMSAPTAESLRNLCRVLDVTPQRLLGMNGANRRVRSKGTATVARGLADQLAELREVAEKAEQAVPDLMGALRDAERKARQLADGQV
jgi:transcriptional regulator with XRE-family HTH domain